MPFRIVPLAVMIAALTSVTPTTSAQSYIEVDPFDSSISAIEKALRTTPDGSNHAILLALRQLRDPAMRPLFQRMLTSEDPTLRIDGLLALAEIGDGTIDPFLLEQFAPRERTIALAAAIDLDLLDKTTIESIRASADLTPVEIVMLSAVGMNFGIPIDLERLRILLEDPDPATATNAAMLLASGGDTAAAQRATERYGTMSPRGREVVAAALSDIASWHPMPSAVELLKLASRDDELSRGVRLAAVDAAVGCECDAGIQLWREAASLAPNSGDRMRMGSMALSRGIIENDWSSIRDERRFNQTLADAGEALATGEGVRTTSEALVTARHPILMEAAVAVADHASPEDAQAIRVAIIEEAVGDPRLLPVASRCISDLADNSPQDMGPLLERLAKMENPLLSEVAVTGLLNSNNPEAWSWVRLFSDHENRTVRSIALLVEARKDAELDDEKLEELALIASGGGRVDPTMRAIAAWLWLKKTGGQDRALARIVGEA